MFLSSYLQTVLCSLPKYLEYILVLQIGLYLQNKDPLKLKLHLNQKPTQNPMEISVINLNVSQPQNVSSLHQEEEQRERRSEGKGKKLFWCKTTLVFSPLLPVPHWSRVKRTQSRPMIPWGNLLLFLFTGPRSPTNQSTVSNDKRLTQINVICLTFLTLSWNV